MEGIVGERRIDSLRLESTIEQRKIGACIVLREVQNESASQSGRALDFDQPTEQPSYFAADRQAQAGSCSDGWSFHQPVGTLRKSISVCLWEFLFRCPVPRSRRL